LITLTRPFSICYGWQQPSFAWAHRFGPAQRRSNIGRPWKEHQVLAVALLLEKKLGGWKKDFRTHDDNA